jgi:hypothetical protein
MRTCRRRKTVLEGRGYQKKEKQGQEDKVNKQA